MTSKYYALQADLAQRMWDIRKDCFCFCVFFGVAVKYVVLRIK